MSASVSQFPKRYTSYKVCYILFKDTPKVYLTLQCPIDKLDDALFAIMQIPQEEAYFYEVHGCLADGSVEVVRGDLSSSEPRGSITVRHTQVVFPGSSSIKLIGDASNRIIQEHSQKTNVRRRSPSGPPPAIPTAKEVKAVVDAALQKVSSAASTPSPNVNDFKVVRTVSVFIEDFK